MSRIQWCWAGIAVAVLATAAVDAGDLPRARPEEVGFSAKRLDYIDQFYAEKVKRGEVAGIVTLIARHGKIAHFSAVGYADVERRQKLETNAIFRIYSMTKPISSTALMILYEEGRFQMDDPLSKYLPEFAELRVLRGPDAALTDTVPVERPPTVQDVLRHTAGFGHGLAKNAVDDEYMRANVFGLDVSLEQMMSKLAKIPLLEQPGKKFIYSVGPDIQARLVEVLSGMPFDQFLEARLFRPLGMKDAGFWVAPDKAKRLATVHWSKDGKLTPLDQKHGFPSGNAILSQPSSVNSYTVNNKHKGGSYGLVSTAEDYWRFAQMMLNGGVLDGVRILSPHVVRFMARDHLAGIGTQTPARGYGSGRGFGLGFAEVEDPAAAGYVASEGGFFWAGAAATYFWIDPKEDMVMVAMTQHLSASAIDPWTLQLQMHSLVYSALMEETSR